jgi:hypothetical protein
MKLQQACGTGRRLGHEPGAADEQQRDENSMRCASTPARSRTQSAGLLGGQHETDRVGTGSARRQRSSVW